MVRSRTGSDDRRVVRRVVRSSIVKNGSIVSSRLHLYRARDRAKWMTYSEESDTVPPTVGRLFDFIYYLENQDR